MNHVLAHFIGDYLLQSHWMATNKTSSSVAAAIHVATYTIPFLFVTTDLTALAIIAVSHFFIDRFRLARHVVAAKNMLSPNPKWEPNGHSDDVPPFLSVWLIIIADNTIHIAINTWAVSL